MCLASTWATDWGMQFSAEKSEHLTIHARKGPVSPESNGDRISMAGVFIPAVDNYRHLGLIINEHLTWTNHIDSVYTTCAQKIGMLNRLSHSVDKNTLARIYLGFIRPRLEYACALWCGENTDKIVKLQKKFCCRHGLDIVSLNVHFSYHTLLLFYQI